VYITILYQSLSRKFQHKQVQWSIL